MRPIDKVLQALDKLNKAYKETGQGHFQASSPLRDDKKPSLSITEKPDGTVVMHDFGGGETKDILAALGLEFKDLYPPSNKPTFQRIDLNQPDLIYSYRNAQGVEVGQVLRYSYVDANGKPDKTFRQRHQSNGQWVWKAPPNMPLYRLPDLLAAHPDLWVFVPEGEKDVDTLYNVALIATTNMGGAARKWADTDAQTLARRKVCLIQDNDNAGKQRVVDLAEQLLPVVKELKVITPEDLKISHIPKGDVTDAIELGLVSGVDIELLAENKPPYQPPPVPPHRRIWFERDDLLTTHFPDPTWLIKDMLPEQSLGILAGRPKIGKSWLCLQLANAIADGAKFLDRETTQTRVLYLALEDNPRRIKNRLKTQGINPWAGLTFAFGWADLLEDGLEKLHNTIIKDSYGLVLIDTFSRAVAVNPDDPKALIEVYGGLQQMAFSTMATILLVDHHRKNFGGVDDVIDAVVDSTAKTAVADLIMGLYRPQRERIGLFKATGRDIDDLDLTIKFNSVVGTWEYMGDTDDVARNEAEHNIVDAIEDLGDDATAPNIVGHVGLAQGYVYQVLKEMAHVGKIVKNGHGKAYSLPKTT